MWEMINCGWICITVIQGTSTFYLFQIMKDSHLALFVCALVMVDVVILLVYTLVEGLMGSLEPKRTVNAENPSEIIGVGIMDAFEFPCGWLQWELL